MSKWNKAYYLKFYLDIILDFFSEEGPGAEHTLAVELEGEMNVLCLLSAILVVNFHLHVRWS